MQYSYIFFGFNSTIKKFLVALFSGILLSTVVVQTAVSHPELLKQTAQNRDYIILGEECDGLLTNDGIICVTDFPRNEEARPFLRQAMLGISSLAISFETLRMIELEPNDNNIAFVFVMDRYVTTSLFEDPTQFPVVRAYLGTDGSVYIDSDYGDFPADSSPEEESAGLIDRHQKEIQMLISALLETR